jgi:hypothetical protein
VHFDGMEQDDAGSGPHRTAIASPGSMIQTAMCCP